MMILKYNFEAFSKQEPIAIKATELPLEENILPVTNNLQAANNEEKIDNNAYITKEQLETVRNDAFQAGYVKSQNELKAKLLELENQKLQNLVLETIVYQLGNSVKMIEDQKKLLEKDLPDLALKIAKKVIGKELACNYEKIMFDMIINAVESMNQTENVIIYLNKESLPKIMSFEKELKERYGEKVVLKESTDLDLYSCKVESNGFYVESSKEKLLNRIEKEIAGG